MPRSSRHKSHRKHESRDGRDRSDSEDDRDSRERKSRAEESSRTRVSRDPEPEKRKTLQTSHGKDVVGSGDDFSGDHGKKRKDRAEDSAVADRWDGGELDDRVVEKGSKKEGFGVVDVEETERLKLPGVDSAGRSSRRRDSSAERNEDGGNRVESEKRRPEKESSRKESGSSLYLNSKERDRERRSERDRKVEDGRHERYDDAGNRRQSSKTGASGEELKKDMEHNECNARDDPRNPELEKELEKRTRRRDGSGDKDKCSAEARDSDDRRLSARDDRMKNGSYKDERYRDGRYRDKHREEIDRDQRQRDEKHRDDHSSRDHNSDKSDTKHLRDENRHSESRYKKIKLHDGDYDGIHYADDYGTKSKDNRGRKKFTDEIEDHDDGRQRSAKEYRDDQGRTVVSTSKFDSPNDHSRSDKVDSNINNSRARSSPSSSTQCFMDQNRSALKAEPMRRGSSGERVRASATLGDYTKASHSRSLEKTKQRDGIHSSELLVETAASQYDRTPRSDGHPSPNHMTEKSSSSATDRRFLNRASVRRSLDTEEVGQRSSAKDGRDFSSREYSEKELSSEKAIVEDHLQVDHLDAVAVAGGSSSFNRTGSFSNNSPSLLPPPPVRLGADSPSVLGSYGDDNRVQSGDRKPNSRYKRSGDLSAGRGQGNNWKNTPTWPSPVANGFIPLQHGPPPGFHPGVQQYPAPLFGVRPTIELSQAGIPYHIHEAADRFSGHGHPFGWRNPVDGSCSPHVHMWDGNSGGIFGDESHAYGRPEWDQNRHIMSNRGWDVGADMWKGQNGNVNPEFSVHQKEPDYSAHALSNEAWVQLGQRPNKERSHTELPAETVGVKRASDTSPPKIATELLPTSPDDEVSQPSKYLSAPEPSKKHSDDSVHFCGTYLSKIDISIDLVLPELYDRCLSLVGVGEKNMEENASNIDYIMPNKEDSRVAPRNSQNLWRAIFPIKTDAVFQSAVALYKKQIGGMKVEICASPPISLKDVKDHSEASDAEKVEACGSQISGEDLLAKDLGEASSDAEMLMACGSQISGEDQLAKDLGEPSDAEIVMACSSQISGEDQLTKDLGEASDAEIVKACSNLISGEELLSNATSATNMEEEISGTMAECDLSHESKEQQSGLVSEGVVLAEGIQPCDDALMPECRVNLSRIPDSPESTH